MGVSRYLYFTAASLSLVGSAAAAGLATFKITLQDAKQCISSVNEARQAADFPNLTEKALFPDSKPEEDSYLKSVCRSLLEEPPVEAKARNTETAPATPAIFRLAGGSSLDCSAAVTDWQSAFSFFEKDPPVREDTAYSDMGVNEYSFVALYNPSDRAQADCRIVLCEQRVAGQQRRTKMRGAQRDEEQNRTEGSEEEEEKKKEDEEQVEEEAEQLTADSSVGQGSDESARGNTASALVCLTSPDVSAKSPLFTQQQWDKIAKAFLSPTSVAVVAVPSFLAFAAVLSGVLLL